MTKQGEDGLVEISRSVAEELIKLSCAVHVVYEHSLAGYGPRSISGYKAFREDVQALEVLTLYTWCRRRSRRRRSTKYAQSTVCRL
jgi:hypothetical protein